MIKKLSEKMRAFSIGTPKESYSFDEVMRYLEDQKTGMVSYFDKEVTVKLDELASEKESLTSEKEELASSVKTLTEEKTKLEGEVESLTGELTPFKEQSKKEKAIELLKGKVASGAEVDAFGLLELEGLDKLEDDKKAEFIDNAINKLFETKPYFKAVEIAEKHDVPKETLLRKEGVKETETKVNTVINGIIT